MKNLSWVAVFGLAAAIAFGMFAAADLFLAAIDTIRALAGGAS